jgi:CheY-like chemotaxis protein
MAHNGQEALDLYSQKAGEIELVVLDLIMPVAQEILDQGY